MSEDLRNSKPLNCGSRRCRRRTSKVLRACWCCWGRRDGPLARHSFVLFAAVASSRTMLVGSISDPTPSEVAYESLACCSAVAVHGGCCDSAVCRPRGCGLCRSGDRQRPNQEQLGAEQGHP